MWAWLKNLPDYAKSIGTLVSAVLVGWAAATGLMARTFVTQSTFQEEVDAREAMTAEIGVLEAQVATNRADAAALEASLDAIRASLEEIAQNSERMEYNQCLLLVEIRGDPNQDRCFR